MSDCSICLVNFASDDDIIVFSCDPKHYFHKSCGVEWLEVKTECPLCRKDFAEEIKAQFERSRKDIIKDVIRERRQDRREREQRANSPASSNRRLNAEQVTLNDLVHELTESMNELQQRMDRTQVDDPSFAIR